MLGGIYTDEKCPLCGMAMVDNHKDAFSCPAHKKQRAGTVFVKFTRDIRKRFRGPDCYNAAGYFLAGLRFKFSEGSYDPRDYQGSRPLAFRSLAEQYLARKRQDLKASSFAKLRSDMDKATNFFQDQNVKDIGYAELDDFFFSLGHLKSKTIYNIRTNLHAFWTWLVKRQSIKRDQMPDFPVIKVELGWRKTINHETQKAILDEVYRICQKKTPRAWLAIALAASNVNVRVGELAGVLEEDVDLERGCIWIHDHKTRQHTQAPKAVVLLEEDIAFIRSLPRGFPKMPFFRRDLGGGGRDANTAFGKHFLLDVWNKACRKLSLEGVGVYGGTRHSTCQHLRQCGKTPEEVKRFTDHRTNKAFNRYLEIQIEEKREAAELAREPASMKRYVRKTGTTVGPPKAKNPRGRNRMD
jgi:integrase